ncbi:winged helix-turn-helix transcriptional regulator [Streptomyces sp. NPDC004629]|uniref:winged helix-turn-helix transcriptional regulator n=1 Tax=Streptomyces sp. NPDC004629 TaxID=3364705 RepID=UPI0036A0B96A
MFFGPDLGAINKGGPLTDAQATALAPRPRDGKRAVGTGPVVLDDRDRLLLDLLTRDGRAPVGELADATGLSVSTVRRRSSDLRADGVLYFDMDYHPDVLHPSAESFRMDGSPGLPACWATRTPA